MNDFASSTPTLTATIVREIESDTTPVSQCPDVFDVDQLLAQAESVNGHSVTVSGLCFHICRHAGRKIFLRGSDRKKVLRVEAGEVGSFEAAHCLNSTLRVTGTLVEQRIDEQFLSNWEARLGARAKEADHAASGGCGTERMARGETAITPEDRIASFRARIARRVEECGKPYLSFYYLTTKEYSVLEPESFPLI